VNERLSPVTEVGLEPVQCSALDLSYKEILHCCVAIGKISTDTTHRAVPWPIAELVVRKVEEAAVAITNASALWSSGYR